MSYSEIIERDRRLIILRALAEDGEYRANSSILQHVLARFGHDVSRAATHLLIGWLEGQALVTVERLETVWVAKLTQAGLDVAKGREQREGVARPGPGC